MRAICLLLALACVPLIAQVAPVKSIPVPARPSNMAHVGAPAPGLPPPATPPPGTPAPRKQ